MPSLTIGEMKEKANRMFEIHEKILDHMTFHKMSHERVIQWDLIQAECYEKGCALMDNALDIEQGMDDDYREEKLRGFL